MSSDREFWGEFLNTYKLYPCLWDYKLKYYSNKQLRDAAKKDLLDKCKIKYPNADTAFVTKKIHGFRCAFRRELNKVIASKKSFSCEIYTPTLWYYDILSFLADSETTEHTFAEDNLKLKAESLVEKTKPKKSRQSSEERKLKNKLYIKLKRENKAYREKEKILDRIRKQEIRTDEEYREKEKALDRKRKQELREDKEHREKKRACDRRRKQVLRANKEYREKELASNRKRRLERKADKEKTCIEEIQEISIDEHCIKIQKQVNHNNNNTEVVENRENNFVKFRENVYNNLIKFYYQNLEYMNCASKLKIE